MRRRRVISEPVQREWLARNMRARRHELSLTMLAASQRGGMHLSHWQKLEYQQSNPSLATLAKLGLALDMDPSALLREPHSTGGHAARAKAGRRPPRRQPGQGRRAAHTQPSP